MLPLLFFVNCSTSKEKNNGGGNLVTSKGTREIGLDFYNTIPSSDFNAGMALAKTAGVDTTQLILGWSEIEATTPNNCTAAGTYVDPHGGSIATFNTLFAANNIKCLSG